MFREKLLIIGLVLIFSIAGCSGKGLIRGSTHIEDDAGPNEDIYTQSPANHSGQFYYEVDAKYYPPTNENGFNLDMCPQAKLDLTDDNQSAILFAELHFPDKPRSERELSKMLPVFSYTVKQESRLTCDTVSDKKIITYYQLFSNNSDTEIRYKFQYVNDFGLNVGTLADLVEDAQSLVEPVGMSFTVPNFAPMIETVENKLNQSWSTINTSTKDFPVYDKRLKKMNLRYMVPIEYDDGKGTKRDAGAVVFRIGANPTRFGVRLKEGIPQFSGASLNTIPNLFWDKSNSGESLRTKVSKCQLEMKGAGLGPEQMNGLLKKLDKTLELYELTDWDRLFCLYMAAEDIPGFGRDWGVTRLPLLVSNETKLNKMGLTLCSNCVDTETLKTTRNRVAPIFDKLCVTLARDKDSRGLSLTNNVFRDKNIKFVDSTGIIDYNGDIGNSILAEELGVLLAEKGSTFGCYYLLDRVFEGEESNLRTKLGVGHRYNAMAVFNDENHDTPLLFLARVETNSINESRITEFRIEWFDSPGPMDYLIEQTRDLEANCKTPPRECKCLLQAMLEEPEVAAVSFVLNTESVPLVAVDPTPKVDAGPAAKADAGQAPNVNADPAPNVDTDLVPNVEADQAPKADDKKVVDGG